MANGALECDTIADAFDHRYNVSWSRNPLSPGNVFGSLATVRDIVMQGEYDIVHVHTPIAAYVTRMALRRRSSGVRPAVIYTAHGFHFYRGGLGARNVAYAAMERRAAAWTDYLVTINHEDLEAARAFSGIDPTRVRYIPGIGVDTDRYAPSSSASRIAEIRAGLGIAPDAFMLTMIAELSPVKRHAHLLRALSTVKDDRVVLVLVGDGPLEMSLRDLAEKLGVSARVRWAGYRRDIPAVLAASDALVLCSEREGLNRSVLEAMSAGKPVIGTATRGIADAITPATGWIVDKHDPASLAAAIDEAARDRDEAAKRGVAGRERAIAEYSLPRIIDAYGELYREAIASRV